MKELTYTEWVAAVGEQRSILEYIKDVRHFRVNSRLKLYELGTVIKNKTIIDVDIVQKKVGRKVLMYKVRCGKCGHEYWMMQSSFSHSSEDCCIECNPYFNKGHDSTAYPDYPEGTRIGRLTVMRSGKLVKRCKDKNGAPALRRERAVFVRCDCGKELWVLFKNLRQGRTTQCANCAKRRVNDD